MQIVPPHGPMPWPIWAGGAAASAIRERDPGHRGRAAAGRRVSMWLIAIGLAGAVLAADLTAAKARLLQMVALGVAKDAAEAKELVPTMV